MSLCGFSLVMSPPRLLITLETWNHENSGLYDFESSDMYRKQYRMETSSAPFKFAIVRKGSDASIEKRSVFADADDFQSVTGRMLLEISGDETEVIVRAPQRLWQVARRNPIALNEGDLVKFGRLKMKVRSVGKGSSTSPRAPSLHSCETELSASEDCGNCHLPDCPFCCSSAALCRICWEGEHHGDPLISPCACKGSMACVHVSCLRRWIAGRMVQKQSAKTVSYYFRDVACELCKVSLPATVEHLGEVYHLVSLPSPDCVHIALETRLRGERGIGVHIVGGKRQIKVGRGLHADLRITDISVSRDHSSLFVLGSSGFAVRDQGSRFGTLVSSGDQMRLRLGDTVQFQSGRTLVTVGFTHPWRTRIMRLLSCVPAGKQRPNELVLKAAALPGINRINSRAATDPSPEYESRNSRFDVLDSSNSQ